MSLSEKGCFPLEIIKAGSVVFLSLRDFYYQFQKEVFPSNKLADLLIVSINKSTKLESS